MSRIGKQLIQIPSTVKVEIVEQEVKVQGPKGNLTMKVSPDLNVQVQDGKISLSPKKKDYSKKTGAIWGLYKAMVANMVEGVTTGFEKKLDIEGVGYRASIEGSDLVLNVGFTNPVKVKCPEGIKFAVEKNLIIVSGIDKAVVGQISAIIRQVKKAEPYKGKGLKYLGEKIRRKEGKKVVAAKK